MPHSYVVPIRIHFDYSFNDHLGFALFLFLHNKKHKEADNLTVTDVTPYTTRYATLSPRD